MENASKALLIAASTMIAVMLLSLMVYMFRRFGATARSTERRYSDQEIEAFNAKFVGYETGGNHDSNDKVSVTFYRGRAGANTVTTEYSFNNIFNKSGALAGGGDNYYKALIATAQTLNKGYDVVTAINDAIDVNFRNNNSYRYDYLEVQNSVEIIVDLGSYKNNFNFNPTHSQYLVIEPNSDVRPKTVYAMNNITNLATNTNTQNKEANVSAFSTANKVSVYDMLDELRDTTVIVEDTKEYTIYKYYFYGEVFTNETTGLVETVKFTLTRDNKNFTP